MLALKNPFTVIPFASQGDARRRLRSFGEFRADAKSVEILVSPRIARTPAPRYRRFAFSSESCILLKYSGPLVQPAWRSPYQNVPPNI